MKAKILYGLAVLVFSISIYNIYLDFTNSKNSSLLTLYEVEALASSETGDDKDEKDQCFVQDCDNGRTCECVMCMKGSVDCSPSCPCCSDK